MNQPEEEQGPEQVQIQGGNRVRREAPKPQKKEEKEDEWGDNVEDDFGL